MGLIMKLLLLQNSHFICKIAPDFGGSIYQFDYQAQGISQNLLRPTWGEDAYLITDFATWPLVPFSNRIKSGQFSFMGTDYRVPVNYLGFPHASHGHGWERPWHVAKHTDTLCELVFDFNDSVIWPFPYQAKQKLQLFEHGLDLQISLINTGTTPMPAGIGHHPYFPKPAGTTLRAKVGHLWNIDKDVIPSERVPCPPEYNFSTAKSLDETQLDHCFDGYGGFMQITWPHRPMKLNVASSPNLDHFVVYTPKGKDFFCAEPVSHMPDAINRMNTIQTGLSVLQPGEQLIGEYRFEAVKAI